MDRQKTLAREAQCIQEQPPACSAVCPVHVDVKGMLEKIRGGDLAGGLAIFAGSIPFPRIIARICDHPCQLACKRVEAGEAIRISALERACVEGVSEFPQAPRPFAKKEKRAAVVGAGLSGLTAAFDLACKGYRITLFEARNRVGGRLRDYPESALPAAAIEADADALRTLGVEFRFGARVGKGDGANVAFDALLEEFDALYLGIGPQSAPLSAFGLSPCANGGEVDTFSTSHDRVFAGGGFIRGAGYSPIQSLQDGRYAAVSVDRRLQDVSLTAMREREGAFATRLYTRTAGIAPRAAVVAADPVSGYTRTEAMEEAGRCIFCECMECVKVCEYLAHYGAYPKRYVRQIAINLDMRKGDHTANRMINSCALCGLCEAVCPEKLSMAEVCREARQEMVDVGRMPPTAHDFALRDMAFSRGEHFALARHAPGSSSSSALFFPGCQLAASSPEHVTRIYQHLRGAIPGGVGIHLGCCGAPADWAGQRELFAESLKETAATWAEMGNPRVIVACSSCYRAFREHLPQAKVESLWTVLAEVGLPPGGDCSAQQTLAIHDPCATRADVPVQEGVRLLLSRLGVSLVEPVLTQGLTSCCGYGGLMSFVNREVADKIVDRRISESDADYVTYCAMCRDNFARRGKRALHLLDLLFGAPGVDLAARKGPTFSERHENRARLKNGLLRELWRDGPLAEERAMELFISPEVLERMEKRMILVEDVERAVVRAEETGERLLDRANGHFLASHRPAAVTYWVEYSPQGTGFAVHNAYSHRMAVE